MDTHGRRAMWALNSAIATTGIVLQFVLDAWGVYPSTTTTPGLFGDAEQGALGRILDYLAYFTVWSNVLVAVTTAMLALGKADTRLWRTLRFTGLLMIAVTGIVYGVVLAGDYTLVGWQITANAFLHQLTPVLTVVVWLVAGPRGPVRWRTLADALALPVVWVAVTLVRGAVVGAYPYSFINVVQLGWPQTLANIGGVLVFGLTLGAALIGVDRFLSRRLVVDHVAT